MITQGMPKSLKFSPEELEETMKNKDLSVANQKHQALERCKEVYLKPNKYHARRTIAETAYGLIPCASKREAEEVHLADLKARAGLIRGFLVQVPFRLPGGFIHRLDIAEINLDGTVRWIEVKGRDLPMGKLKRRQVEELYHIIVEVIK